MISPASTPRNASALNAIVTGAGSGLGRAIAVRLARDGWHLALADVNQDGCQETAELVRQVGGTAQFEHLDVSRADEWAQLVERLRTQWTQLDLLVNNAGVSCAGAIGMFPLADWRWALDINLFGPIQGCHTCRDWLVANPQGAHVVNVASAAAIVTPPTMAPYNVGKAGVVALSETMFAELRPLGVGVTVVCPGFFPTNLIAGGRFYPPEERDAANLLMRGARISAEQVAEATVRAIARKRLYVVLPEQARRHWRLRRLCPTTMIKFFSWGWYRGTDKSPLESIDVVSKK